MTSRISVALAGILAAALCLFATAPQTPSKVNRIEAARLNNLGAAYMNQQLFEKGLKSFQRAAELDPALTMARLNEGIALLNLQKIDEAKVALQDALKQDPKNPNAWYNLGLLAKNTGDAQTAIEAFHHVVDIDPNDADTWYFLGTAYVQAKEFPQAIDAFQHALELNPLHASAEFGLSRAYQQSTDIDRAREHLKRFQYITQNKIGAPMSLAYGEQGQYSRAVESPQAVMKPPVQIKVQFVDVTKAAGIVSKPAPVSDQGKDEGLGAGACFLDYDGDGRPDLFLADDGPQAGMVLYHNLGNGKFEDVTRQAGLDSSIHAFSCTAGDYDNDGFVDLAVSRGDGILLLHNEKNGTFKDVAAAAGIKGVIGGLTFIDYDHDGDLDLYGADGMRECMGNCHASSVVWRNNGDGSFKVVDIGVVSSGPTSAAVGTDYNNDRAGDLLVADSSGGTMFQNPREGKFIPSHPFNPTGTGDANLPSFVETIGVTALDFDHDGWMDVALTQMGA